VSALDEYRNEIVAWPDDARMLALAALQRERWRSQARAEQLAPEGDWRVWYLQAGRGAGKSRAGAEWLAEQEGLYPPGSWAIVAPTYSDARDTCAEEQLLPILGPRVKQWNRGDGEIFLRSGSRIYLDGADDGALRIQGKNLKGVWADEVGLWQKWDLAWNWSISFAVRMEPARIVATGTPKMGHGLVRQLVEDPTCVKTRMRMADNIGNLPEHVVARFYEENKGSFRGRQELDGEWIAALEGDALKRAWWKYYEPQQRGESVTGFLKRLPKFQWVVVSADTPLKDKQASDNVAIQVWGADKATRYLLDARNEKMSYEQAKRAIREMSMWARRSFNCQHRTLIENAGYGPELLVDLNREIGSVQKIQANAEGNKGQRALAAAGDLETGNCYLPGRSKDDLSGPDERWCPAMTLSLVEECALFQIDGSHDTHDDQVDAWSQCMNWLRARQTAPARTWSSFRASRAR
jgi:predicted phage terminase large subunit-like protein